MPSGPRAPAGPPPLVAAAAPTTLARRLQSVERVFGSQSLATPPSARGPPGPPGGTLPPPQQPPQQLPPPDAGRQARAGRSHLGGVVRDTSARRVAPRLASGASGAAAADGGRLPLRPPGRAARAGPPPPPPAPPAVVASAFAPYASASLAHGVFAGVSQDEGEDEAFAAAAAAAEALVAAGRRKGPPGRSGLLLRLGAGSGADADAAPAPPAGEDFGFRISYSQSYSRAPSVALPVVEAGGGGAPAGAPPLPPAPLRVASPRPAPVAPGPSGAAALRSRSVTPELDDGVDGGAGGRRAAGSGGAGPSGRRAAGRSSGGGGPGTHLGPRLFPVFRPAGQRKVLHLVRHGESEYNAAVNAAGTGFADPLIFDPALTLRGRRQAARLAATLRGLDLPGGGASDSVLWVASPLTRAIETLLLGCPVSGALAAAPHVEGDAMEGGPGGGVGGGNGGVPPAAAARPPADLSPSAPPVARLAIRPELAEHLATTGDVGLPASAIAARFPALAAAGALAGLPERWWYAPHANDAAARLCAAHEPRRALVARVGAFRAWVMGRPERVVVAFGHATHLGELAGGGTRLRNCEVHTMHL